MSVGSSFLFCDVYLLFSLLMQIFSVTHAFTVYFCVNRIMQNVKLFLWNMVRSSPPVTVTYITTHPFNSPCSRTVWVSRYQKGKTSLDLNEAMMIGFWDVSGISWTICKQSAPHSRQITTPTPHHSIFKGQMLFLTPNQQCQSTEGK